MIDGTGSAAKRADVRVAGGKIVAVGRLSPEAGERVLDVGGLTVTPGFIDSHSHADGGLAENPDADTHVLQGITTATVGQDGGHGYPLAESLAKMAALRPGINYASFVGHATVRSQILGKDYKRPSSPDEVAKMCQLVDSEMKAGALGLSSGLEYDMGFYAQTSEVIALAAVAGKRGGSYISHVRDEENGVLGSFAELIEIAKKAKVAAEISHIKLGSSPVWGKAKAAIAMMRDARRAGISIGADVYPYTYWQSSITVIIPDRDFGNRATWQKGLDEIGGPKNVRLTEYTPEPSWKGKTIAEIAKETGRDAITIIQEIVAKTQGENAGRQSVVVTAMQEKDVETFVADPYIAFCTDGGLRPSHPRGAGSFPRLLGHYVREKRILPLHEAVRKMSSLPAARFGLTDRGVIKPGKAADLVIFDPKTVIDRATIQNPAAPPEGMAYVIVNGAVAVDRGKVVGARSGQILRRG